MSAPFDLDNLDESFFDSDALIPPKGGKHMAGENYPNEKLTGAGNQLKTLPTGRKTAMITKKLDPSDIIDGIESGGPAIDTQDRVQEDAKMKWQAETTTLNGLKNDYYSTFSRGVDMVITAYGRGSLEAKEATRIRKELTGSNGKDKGTNPPTP